MRCLVALVVLATLVGCTAQTTLVVMDGTPIAASPASESQQPPNLGQLKRALDRYRVGAYMSDVADVDADAKAWVLAEAPKVGKPALVLDIDETSLSNMDEMVANDYGFIPGGACDALPHGPCGFSAWVKRAQAPALAPTLDLANAAEAAHVAVFFITGRSADLTRSTADNLRRAGYHDWAGLVLEPSGQHFTGAAAFKTPARAAIEAQGYTILASVGDQYSDLAGGHAMRGFKLPNPFYYLP